MEEHSTSRQYGLVLAFAAGEITSTRTFIKMRLDFEQSITLEEARQQVLALIEGANVQYKVVKIPS